MNEQLFNGSYMSTKSTYTAVYQLDTGYIYLEEIILSLNVNYQQNTLVSTILFRRISYENIVVVPRHTHSSIVLATTSICPSVPSPSSICFCFSAPRRKLNICAHMRPTAAWGTGSNIIVKQIFSNHEMVYSEAQGRSCRWVCVKFQRIGKFPTYA